LHPVQALRAFAPGEGGREGKEAVVPIDEDTQVTEGLSTRAIHTGQEADTATGATIVPIYQSATYTWDGLGRDRGFKYSRTSNPTRKALETCLAALEGGAHGLAFASGSAAAAAVFSLLRPGDHVIATSDLYSGTFRLLESTWRPLGVDVTYVEGAGAADYARAVRPSTVLIWLETPSNPLLRLVDIGAVAAQARAAGARLAVDNTVATPAFQQPLALGADFVVHSTTKYLGGHSDVVGGAVVVDDDELYGALKAHQNSVGAVPGIFDAWLVLRGLKTLELRMERHAENARQVALFLADQAAVGDVIYPSLPSYAQRELAERQMSGYSGLVTFHLADRDAVDRFVRGLRLFSLAESLGGVESLVNHPESMTHSFMPEAERLARGILPGTVRLSIGIENAPDLLADLEGALSAL
jgi:cystathionine beta-lyase/cystathionine gamma-synthase